MKKIKLVLFLSALLSGFSVFSQSKIFDNVLDIEVQSTVEIVNNKQIVGYAFFYKIDKMKKSALYRLSILDENLKEIGSNEFEGAKDLYLRRAVYESDRLFFSFYDKDKTDGYEQFVKVYDLKGKDKGLVPYEPEKVKRGFIGAAMAKGVAHQMEEMYQGYENVEGKGYVAVYQGKAKTGGVDIQMVGNNGKLLWEQNYTAEKGDRTDMYLVGATANTILLFQIERSGLSAADADVFLIGLSADKGKELFKKPMDINDFTYEPMLFKKNDDKIIIISTITNHGDKFYNAKPIGLNIGELNDQTGEIKTIKDFMYKTDLGNVLTMVSDSKSEEGYMKIHDMCKLQNGGFILVGEFFRKTVSGLGVASIVLGGNASASQATVEDLFLLRIDNSLKATALEKIEKDKQRYPIPAGAAVGLIARYLTYIHGYGYMYTDEGLIGDTKTIVARGSFGEDKYGTVAITVDPKKGFTTKRFNLEKEKKVTYFISRAKPGYVMITKYNSKEKSLSVNLEKVN